MEGEDSNEEEKSPEKEPVPLHSFSFEKQGKKQFEIVKSSLTFKDVGGMESLKKELRMKIVYPFENKELFGQYGKKAGGGLIFFGPPGCGKTHIAKACAGEIKFNFINVTITDIKNMWYGNTEKNIAGLFEFARKNKPAVLFIDEIDALCLSRNKIDSDKGSITNQFLTELDGVVSNNDEILVVGATNAPWAIDSAFMRPGRFDKTIFVAPPESEGREEILKIMLKDKPKEELDFKRLAKLTNGFSGADLKHLVELSIDELLQKCLEEGRKEAIKISQEVIEEQIPQVIPSTRKWFSQVSTFIEFSEDDALYEPVKEFLKIKKKEDVSYFG